MNYNRIPQIRHTLSLVRRGAERSAGSTALRHAPRQSMRGRWKSKHETLERRNLLVPRLRIGTQALPLRAARDETLRRGREASGRAFPRGAWERE